MTTKSPFSSSSFTDDSSQVSGCRSSSSSSDSSSFDTLFAFSSSSSSTSSHTSTKTSELLENQVPGIRRREYLRLLSEQAVSSVVSERPSEKISSRTGFFHARPQKLSTSNVKQASVTGDSSPLPSAPIDEEKQVLQLKSTLETETQKWEKIISGFVNQTKYSETKLFLKKILRDINRIKYISLKTANSRADYENALSCWEATKDQVKARIEKNSDTQGLLQQLLNPIPINHDTLDTQPQKTLSF